MLAVGDDEIAMAPGKALRLVDSLVGWDMPEDGDSLPTVDDIRGAYPDPVHVGNTTDGKAVTLRSLVGGDDDEDDQPDDGEAPTAE
jgi:hypothetical protein